MADYSEHIAPFTARLMGPCFLTISLSARFSEKIMIVLSTIFIFLIGLFPSAIPGFSQSFSYPWLERYRQPENIVNRIPVPDGYERINTTPGTFADWLRWLPLKEGRPPVYLFNGQKKGNQEAHFAVVDIDVGKGDLQQCADAVIRLRAEYLYFIGEYDTIHFKFTSGHEAKFRKWIEGYRPVISGNEVRWVKSAKRDSSYTSFREYLNSVFMYAGSYSLSRELCRVKDLREMKIGNVFIEGGFPGHAVIVVDMAVNGRTGKRLFLLVQSYMPAQEIHILKNPIDSKLNPWYELEFGETLYTPEWTFRKSDLKRF